jgi:hypothetical protein
LNSLFIPRLVVFVVCVIAFFVGLYLNKRDDERDKALYDEQRKRAQERKKKQETERLQELERRQTLYKERLSSAARAMTAESQLSGLGGGAAEQGQGQQPKRTIH